MKSRAMIPVSLVCCVLALGACTGLQQFPQVSEDYSGDLTKHDLAYDTALTAINAASADADEQKRIRNEEIDRRLRVIDLNFSEFRRGLATEGVAADFGIAVVQLGLGGAGALVSQTASQILSAVSGGLAGTQQAYSKAALYEKTVSALLAQMIASRKAVLVLIFTGRTQGIDDYPLSAAVLDLEAYQYAGSLPGAVIATAADAQVKNDQAQTQLNELTTFQFEESTTGQKLRVFWMKGGESPDPNNTSLLKAEMAKHGLETGPGRIANFINGAAFSDLRAIVAKDLGL